MNLNNIHSIYFIGIGGIGMSGLARYFNANGRSISGYDKTSTALTDELINEGIAVHFSEDVDQIPKEVDLVVYTPAVPSDHRELAYYREHNYHVIKRADLLEELTKDLFTIAVAGTHGKTTTSSMIAHILKSSGYDCTAFLGGITANYNSNFLAGTNKTVVVEADEFDRSFLKLHPDIAVVTSSDPDHLDVYGSHHEVVKAYGEFGSLVKDGGGLITKKNLPFIRLIRQDIPVKYYGTDEETETEFIGQNLRMEEGTFAFDFKCASMEIRNIHLSVAGRYNVENAVAAAGVASELKIDPEKIRTALSSFRGVKRRFEFIVRNKNVVYIDDYAHHPAEISALLNSIREIYPDKKITCIFQPHLYTRTRDFAEEFSDSLSHADEVILLPIYEAREFPIDGVSSSMLLAGITTKEKMVCRPEELLNTLKKRKIEVLITVGAGDIDQFIEPIKEMLMNEYKPD